VTGSKSILAVSNSIDGIRPWIVASGNDMALCPSVQQSPLRNLICRNRAIKLNFNANMCSVIERRVSL
jgi:hypothetical protein